MIIKSGKVKVKDTNILEGISKKSGNPYKLYIIYVEENGIVYKLLADERIMKKAESLKEKQVEVVYYIDPYGKLTLNDINV